MQIFTGPVPPAAHQPDLAAERVRVELCQSGLLRDPSDRNAEANVDDDAAAEPLAAESPN